MGVHVTKSQTDKPAASQPAPAQWQSTSAGLSMRADATDAGRLVRLADVALWLIESEGLPRIPAVQRLADELAAARPAPALFMAQSGQYAKPIEGDAARFGYHTIDSWAVDRLAQERLAAMNRDPWRYNLRNGGIIPARLSDAVMAEIRAAVAAGARPAVTLVDELTYTLIEPGVPALLRLLRRSWAGSQMWWIRRTDAQAFTDRQLPGLAVAVRVADAARIWGWGRAVELVPAAAPVFPLKDWPALAAYRLANPGTAWALGNQIEIGRAEFTRRGGNDPGRKRATLDAMARDVGMSRGQPLERALWGEHRKRKPAPSMAGLPAKRHTLAG